MARTRDNNYWADRSAKRLVTVERQTRPYEQKLLQLHKLSIQTIREDMNRILDVFAKNSDLTGPEALEILQEVISEGERMQILQTASQIPDVVERAKMMAKVNAPAYRARMQRLEAIELATEARLKQLAPETIQTTHDALFNAGTEMFNRTMFDVQRGVGIGFKFNGITEKEIETVLRHSWTGKHYSDRIWGNTEQLAERVAIQMENNLVTGRSWRRSLADMEDLVEEQGSYNVKRLLRTETSYVANETEAIAYEEADLDEYRFVSILDGRTSKMCQELDGDVFKLKDRKTGVNYPPIHPFCRSTTIAVIDGLKLEELKRRAKDPTTGKVEMIPANTTYKDWMADKNKLPLDISPK